jgi:hypothetical protein
MANKMASLVQVDMDKLSVTKTSWGQQFQDAMNVNGGDLETAKMGHYIGHALAFFWKVIFNKFKIFLINSSLLKRCFLPSYRQQQWPAVG